MWQFNSAFNKIQEMDANLNKANWNEKSVWIIGALQDPEGLAASLTTSIHNVPENLRKITFKQIQFDIVASDYDLRKVRLILDVSG